MTRNMFDDVIGPSITVGGKRRLTVPLSIAAHTIVIAALIMIPLLAVDSSFLPAPPAMMSFIHVEARLPPPPSAPPAHASPTAEPVVTANPDAAPLEAPSTVAPEHEVQPSRGLIGTVEGSMGVVLAGVLGDSGPPPAPVASAVAPPPPVHAGGAIRQPTKVTHVAPIYPPVAQAARVEGVVIIEATISPTGKVENAKVLRSIPLLDAAAIDAVRQWQYTPTFLNGVPVPVIITVTVDFRLR